jgi:uncharacterized protein YigE (DUF2233 family)
VIRRWLILLLFCSACTSQQALPPTEVIPTLLPSPTAAPAPSPEPVVAASPSPAPADTGWLDAGPGLALRRLRFESAAGLSLASVVRIDPALVRFRVAYAPEEPRALQRWHETNNALATINGGFFDAQNRTTSLLISDGVASGDSYVGRGGIFAVDANGAVTLRYLAEQPYDPAEPWLHALEGWPMLVRPGGVLAYTFEDNERARRSALAIDRDGKVLLIAVATPTLTLRELAEWLATSDLAIDAALNLDGGSSTGLLLSGAQQTERIDAFVPLPIVLMVVPA